MDSLENTHGIDHPQGDVLRIVGDVYGQLLEVKEGFRELADMMQLRDEYGQASLIRGLNNTLRIQLQELEKISGVM